MPARSAMRVEPRPRRRRAPRARPVRAEVVFALVFSSSATTLLETRRPGPDAAVSRRNPIDIIPDMSARSCDSIRMADPSVDSIRPEDLAAFQPGSERRRELASGHQHRPQRALVQSEARRTGAKDLPGLQDEALRHAIYGQPADDCRHGLPGRRCADFRSRDTWLRGLKYCLTYRRPNTIRREPGRCSGRSAFPTGTATKCPRTRPANPRGFRY